MRGRQQYYLTIGCASNWADLAPPPWRDIPIFRGPAAGQVPWRAGSGACSFFAAKAGRIGIMSSPSAGCWACPVPWVGGWGMPMIGQGQRSRRIGRYSGAYVQPPCRPRGMSRGGAGSVGVPVFGQGWRSRRIGRYWGSMPSPCAGRGECPVAGAGRVGHAHFSRPRLGALGLCPASACRRGHVPQKALARGGEAQLGEAGKFRYSSICF